MRVFVIHDEEGNVVSVGQFEELHEAIDRPFQVTNPKHAVVELDKEDEGFKAIAADRTEGKKKGLLKAHTEFVVENRKTGGKGLTKKMTRPPVAVDPTPNPGPVGPAPPGKQPLPKAPAPPAPAPPKGGTPGETPPTRPVPEAEEM